MRALKTKFATPDDKAHTWLPYSDGQVYLTGNRDATGSGDIIMRSWGAAGSYTDMMRIKGSSGNVGIGEGNPAANLSIVDNRPLISLGSTVTNNGMRFEYYEPGQELRVQRSHQNGGYDGATLMTIERAGNVGIGTTNPTHKLAVNGTIRAKEVIVDSGWSDYVFEDDYRLAPLAEVEAHIAAHGHLPGIPSATEIEQNGAKLSELVTLQMAKIEELTLHLIEKEKQLSSANERIENQAADLSDLRRSNAQILQRLIALEN